jgi:hypothetical protein
MMIRLRPAWTLALALLAGQVGAQRADSTRGRWTAPAVLLGDASVELDRSLLLRGDSARYSHFRSTSSLTPRLSGSETSRSAFVLPHLRFVHNSDLPYSLNDGALWAGRGTNTDVIAGIRLEGPVVRLFLLPELVISANDSFDVTVPSLFGTDADRSPWASPFHHGSQVIDLPIRFGDRPIRRLYPGQSSLVISAGKTEVGLATENDWWGPGIRNSLVITDNAAGFPHAFIRTPGPIETPVGAVEARWMAGGLSDSKFFYTGKQDYLRSIALLGISIRPRGLEGLSVGAARSVYDYVPTKDWGRALTSFFDVFHDVGQPDAVPLTGISLVPGPDQLVSVFMRWAFPSDGFEVYGEWGRAEFPKSLRDFLEQPNHTQGYVLGLQWLGLPIDLTDGRLRVQAEATFLQQSSTFRFRPLGSWYTSAATIHGYTERGQVIGAGIGPGSSSQWVAMDHLGASWSLGGYVNRIRWLEDARSQAFTSVIEAGWCEHDVSLLGGIRGTIRSRAGTISADYSTGWRYNLFFNHDAHSCPFNQGKDVRNQSLSVTFAPAALRW